ncbi:12536_t:CDS:2, partial [Funneliformis caledonium]
DINDSLMLENSFPNNFDLTSDNSNNNDDYMNINFSNDVDDNSNDEGS